MAGAPRREVHVPFIKGLKRSRLSLRTGLLRPHFTFAEALQQQPRGISALQQVARFFPGRGSIIHMFRLRAESKQRPLQRIGLQSRTIIIIM